jgi:hypothetical protein
MALSEMTEAHVAEAVRSIHQVQKLVVLGSKGKAGDDPSRARWATAAEAAPNKAVEPKRTEEKQEGVLMVISCHT